MLPAVRTQADSERAVAMLEHAFRNADERALADVKFDDLSQHFADHRVAAWPAALTPALRDVLGMMCFQLGSYARVYRAAGEFVAADGEELKSRAEDEQAFMLHKLVGWALQHGSDWPKYAQTDLDRARAVVALGQL